MRNRDKAQAAIIWLFALCALLGFSTLYFAFISYGETWKANLGNAWTEFLLPVITNAASTLLTVFFSLLFFRWIQAILEDKDKESLAEDIARKVKENLEVINTNLEGVKSSVSQDLKRIEGELKQTDEATRKIIGDIVAEVRRIETDKSIITESMKLVNSINETINISRTGNNNSFQPHNRTKK